MNNISAIQMMHKVLTPNKCTGTKRRIGAGNDGGYVIINEVLANTKFCLCFGAGGNIDVEKHLASIGKKTECFDAEPDFNHLPELKDIPIGGSKNLSLNLNYHRTNVDGNNIDSIIPTESYFLKMDIEGGEWEVLRNMSDSHKSKMNMLVVEYHLNNEYYRSRNLLSIYDVLVSIKNTHHLVHIHGNNYDIPNYGGTKIPAVVECCYINKSLGISTDEIDCSEYPSIIDTPNNLNAFDYKLDWWK
jgi:hypothetical protein